VRSNFDLFRSQESYHIDQAAWQKPLLKLLGSAVEREYFSMPFVQKAVKNQFLPPEAIHMRFLDYRVILNQRRFNWHAVAQQLDRTVEECFY